MRKEIKLNSFDSPDDGVAHLLFAIERTADHVTMTAHMVADEDVMDASESDFPLFIATMSVEEYRRLREIFVRFQP